MKRSHKFFNIHSFLNMVLIWLIKLLITDFKVKNGHFELISESSK